MENTKLSLPQWFFIIEEVCTGQLSSRKIAEKGALNYRTVLYARHKINHLMAYLNDGKLEGKVEADELIRGSITDDDLRLGERVAEFNKKEKEMKEADPNYKIQAYGNKRLILNILQRKGRAIVKLMGASKRDITTANIRKILENHVSDDVKLYLDRHATHLALRKITKDVRYITHTERIPVLDANGQPLLDNKGKPKMDTKKRFVDDNGHHTNGVENSNKQVTRFLRTFIKHSYKYAQLYYNEYVFHYWCKDMLFLEKMREILWNCQADYITVKELQNRPNEFPEHQWKPRKKSEGKKHSRKKKDHPVNFKFS